MLCAHNSCYVETFYLNRNCDLRRTTCGVVCAFEMSDVLMKRNSDPSIWIHSEEMIPYAISSVSSHMSKAPPINRWCTTQARKKNFGKQNSSWGKDKDVEGGGPKRRKLCFFFLFRAEMNSGRQPDGKGNKKIRWLCMRAWRSESIGKHNRSKWERQQWICWQTKKIIFQFEKLEFLSSTGAKTRQPKLFISLWTERTCDGSPCNFHRTNSSCAPTPWGYHFLYCHQTREDTAVKEKC